jgi:hypothetical protein
MAHARAYAAGGGIPTRPILTMPKSNTAQPGLRLAGPHARWQHLGPRPPDPWLRGLVTIGHGPA